MAPAISEFAYGAMCGPCPIRRKPRCRLGRLRFQSQLLPAVKAEWCAYATCLFILSGYCDRYDTADLASTQTGASKGSR